MNAASALSSTVFPGSSSPARKAARAGVRAMARLSLTPSRRRDVRSAGRAAAYWPVSWGFCDVWPPLPSASWLGRGCADRHETLSAPATTPGNVPSMKSARLAAGLSSCHGADDEVGLGPGGDGFGQGVVGRVVGQVLLAGEEPDEGAPGAAVVAADGAAEHRV